MFYDTHKDALNKSLPLAMQYYRSLGVSFKLSDEGVEYDKEQLIRLGLLDGFMAKVVLARMVLKEFSYSKVFLFSKLQAQYFYELNVLPHNYQNTFNCPFKYIFIEFDSPVDVTLGNFNRSDKLRGVLVSTNNNEFYGLRFVFQEGYFWEGFEKNQLPVISSMVCAECLVCNHLRVLPKGQDCLFDISWDDNRALKECCDNIKNTLRLSRLFFNTLNYINCTNVERIFEKGRAEKRDKKGDIIRRKLSDYYIVKLKSRVIHVSDENYGEGTKHSIRYDVRGHFRHYDDGKVIWIADHQRGLSSKIYKPKRYAVE